MFGKSQKTLGTNISNAPQVYDDQSSQNKAHQDLHATQHPASDSQDSSGTDAAHAAWSHTKTQGYGSQKKQVIIAEDNRHQLEQWAYETSNAQLTVTERLEKSKWEAGN
ncbi:hypothetical protein EG329_001154 [Mollisiaceae sp. DMI_Dod_QoI]|nr:hypothetical protein EG329_001154 [Helotiales sp. DMI_Dod_QoI]